MNRLLRRIRRNIKDNSGMALVTVIVAIGFVAALVSILMATTLVNYKMKVVNERGKDTFYSAEQVLDEITVGLQRRVSDSLSSSYTYVLENYGDLDNDQKNQIIQTHYYTNLWSYLEPTGSMDHMHYDVTKLEEFLKDTTKWHEYSTTGETGSGDGYGAIVTAVVYNESTGRSEDTKLGDMFTYSGSGIVLKDVKIYYKDIYGFVSVIQTDIRLNYPGFEFAKNSAVADVTNYCFIADGGVERGVNPAYPATGDFDIDGYIYANNFKTNGSNITVSENSLFIVKHDIDIEGNGFSFKALPGTAIWAKNLKARSANIDINGTVNLSNDLALSGTTPKAKISGTYNGYGNSMISAEESSAILINGKQSTLDFSGVRDMKLYGHAYLGLSSAENMSEHEMVDLVTGDPNPVDPYQDVITGESIAAKPDQLMYLVPADAIGVDLKTGKSLYNTNPMTKAEYNDILARVDADAVNTSSSTEFVWIADDIPISSLNGARLKDYVAYSPDGHGSVKPKVYKHEIRVSDGTTGSIVYFYMLFDQQTYTDDSGNLVNIPAEQVANNYFQLYYQNNQDSVDRYTNAYVNSITIPELRPAQMTRAGYSYITEYVGGVKTLGIWAETQENVSETRNADKEASELKFHAYTTKLIPNYSELGSVRKTPSPDSYKEENKDDPEGQAVFENIVQPKDDIVEYIARAADAGISGDQPNGLNVTCAGTGDSRTITYVDSEGNTAIVTTAATTTISDDDVHLVISTGDVIVTANTFDGVILCDGKLTFGNTASLSCSRNAELVIKCMQFGYSDGNLTYAIASLLDGGNDFIYSSYGDGYSGADSLAGLVTYENWKKE